MAILIPAVAMAQASRPLRAATGPAAPLTILQLIEQLHDRSWVMREDAIRALASFNVPEAHDPLARILREDPEPHLRARALVALTAMRKEAMLPQIEAAAADAKVQLRRAAGEAAGLLPQTARAAKLLERQLGDADVDVRYQAAASLAGMQGQSAWKTIAPCLRTIDTAHARLAAQALARAGTGEALAQVETLLAASDAAIQLETLRGLSGALDPSLVRAILQYAVKQPADAQTRQVAWELLQSYGSRLLLEALTPLLSSRDSGLAIAACSLLYMRPSPQAGAAVAAELRKGGNFTADLILAILDMLGAPESAPERYADVYKLFLDHKSPAVRARAIQRLCVCRDEDLVALLRPAMSDADASVTAAALEGLAARTDQPAPAEGVARYLNTPLGRSDDQIALCLPLVERWGNPAAFADTLAKLKPVLGGVNDALRQKAAAALGKFASEREAPKIAAAQGYLINYHVIGPFLFDDSTAGMAEVYPPETEIDFQKSYTAKYTMPKIARRDGGGSPGDAVIERKVNWREWTVTDPLGEVRLDEAIPPPAALSIAYAVCDITLPRDQAVTFLVDADDAHILWVNGAKLSDGAANRVKYGKKGRYEYQVPAEVKVTLKTGDNRVLMKVGNKDGPFWCRVRAVGADKRAVVLQESP